MDTTIFDGSFNLPMEEDNNVSKYIDTKNSINNNILFYFILIVVILLTSYCGYNIIGIFTTCKENFIIKYIKLFCIIPIICSTTFIIPTYYDVSDNIQEQVNNDDTNKRNNIIEKITRIIKYTLFPIVVSIIMLIFSSKQKSPHKVFGILSNILIIAPIIIGAIINLIIIIMTKIEPNNTYYIFYYFALFIFYFILVNYFDVIRKYKNYKLFSLKTWGYILLFTAIVLKYINNFIILINNSLNVKDYNNTKLKLNNINNNSKIKSVFDSIVVSDIIYYCIKIISDIVNIISFYFFGAYITKQNIFGDIKINGYDNINTSNNSDYLKDFVIGGLSTKLLFTNYSMSNLDPFSNILSYLITIFKFKYFDNKGFFYNLLKVGTKTNLEDCLENNKQETQKIQNTQTGGSDRNITWVLIFSFFLSFDTYIKDNIIKLVYILMKLISIVILYNKTSSKNQ